MIFDALSADAPARTIVLDAIRARRLLLLTTHVQEHQLADIEDAVKRKRLQKLPREVVPSSIQVAGVSRRGHARLHVGHDWQETHLGRHAKDLVIAEAAAERADVLVTEDKRLIEEADARGITVWRTADLIAWASEDG